MGTLEWWDVVHVMISVIGFLTVGCGGFLVASDLLLSLDELASPVRLGKRDDLESSVMALSIIALSFTPLFEHNLTPLRTSPALSKLALVLIQEQGSFRVKLCPFTNTMILVEIEHA